MGPIATMIAEEAREELSEEVRSLGRTDPAPEAWAAVSVRPGPLPWRERPKAAWRILTGGSLNFTAHVMVQQRTPVVSVDAPTLIIDRRSR